MSTPVDATRILIDSHVYIWLLFEQHMVAKNCRQIVEEAEAAYVSAASLWELVLKANKGTLKYSPRDLIRGREELGVALLGVSEQHILDTSRLKMPHKDPFDTMLAAQAKAEGLVLLTADRYLLNSRYPAVDARL